MADIVVTKIRLDGKEFVQYSPEHFAHVEAQVSAERTRADQEKARADGLASEVTKAKDELAKASDPKRLDSLVKAKAELIANATAVLGSEFKFDGLSDRDIMVAVVKSDRADFDPKTESDDYVRASYDGVVKRGKRADGVASLPAKIAAVRGDAGKASEETPESPAAELPHFDADDETDWADQAEKAEREMRERNANAWRRKSA